MSSAAFSAYTSQAMDKLGGQRMQAPSLRLEARQSDFRERGLDTGCNALADNFQEVSWSQGRNLLGSASLLQPSLP